MNEKIKELIDQATTSTPRMELNQATYEMDPTTFYGTPVYDKAFNEEQFANLILQEVIKVIEHEISYNQFTLSGNTSYKIHNMASLLAVIGTLKQHFGI
jgi:hypothetical protein